MRPAPIILTLAAAAGLAAGYLLTPAPQTPPPPPAAKAPAGTTPEPAVPAGTSVAPPPARYTAATEFIAELESAAAADLPAVLDRLLGHWKNNRGELYHLQIGPLIERWVALDPAAGVRYALSVDRKGIASEIMTAWAEKNPDAALAAAAAWDPAERRPALNAAALNALASSDPVRFREHVLAGISPNFTLSGDAFFPVLEDLARSDLDAATAFADALPKGNRTTALALIARTVAATSPAAATHWAMTITDPDVRDRAMRQVATTVGADDPAAAAGLLEKFDDPSDFPAYAIAQKIAATDPDRALTWMLSIDNKQAKRTAAQLFVRDVAATDPGAALANLDRILDALPADDINLYNTATNNFRRVDPAAFPDLAAAVTPDTNPAAVAALARDWMRHDPGAALTWLGTAATAYPEGDGHRIADSVVSSFRSLPASKLPDIAPQLPSLVPHLDHNTARNLASSLARSDDPAVAAFVNGHLTASFVDAPATPDRIPNDPFADPATLRNTAGGSVTDAFVYARFKRLAEADPLAAAGHATSVEDPGQRSAALSSTAWNWAAYAPEAATAWATGLEDSADRDHAIAGIAGHHAHRDPVTSLTWTAAITDPAVRTETTGRLVRSLHRRQLQDLRPAVPDLGLPAGESAALIEAIDRSLKLRQ